MKTILCLLLGLASPLLAAPPEVQVRVVIFDALESDWLEKAAQEPVGDASSSFARLVAGVGDGSVTLAGDSMVQVRSGNRSKNEGLVEFPYPTEFDPQEERQFPASFEFKNTGTTLECEATVAEGWIDLNLAMENNRLREMRQVPAIVRIGGAYQQGAVPQPVFLSEKIATQVACLNGVPVLIAQSRPADIWEERPGGAGQRTLLTFVIAGLRGDFPAGAAGGKPGQSRLHVAAVRMDAEAALALLETENNKGGRFARAAAMAAEGQALFVSNAAVLCRHGQKSRMESVSEFPWPTEMGGPGGLMPQSFEFSNIGDTLEWELSGEGTSMDVAHELGGWPVLHRSEARGDTPGAALEMPEFQRMKNLMQQLSITPGVWKHLITSTCQDDERSLPGKGNSIVWFARLVSVVPVPETQSSSLHAAKINLDPAEAAAWKARPVDEVLAADLVRQAVADDRLSLTGALSGTGGSREVGVVRERLFPDTNKIQSAMAHQELTGSDGLWKLTWPAAESTGPELSEVIDRWTQKESIPDASPPGILERTWTLAGSGQTFSAKFSAAQNTDPARLNFSIPEMVSPPLSTDAAPMDPFAGSAPFVRNVRKVIPLTEFEAEDQAIIRDAISRYTKWKAEWQDPQKVKTWQAEMEFTQLPVADGKWHFSGWNETEGPEGMVTTAVLLRRE